MSPSIRRCKKLLSRRGVLRHYSDHTSSIPIGNPRPVPNPSPLIAYPLVERDLLAPTGRVGFYDKLASSSGYSQILDVASWASGTKGPYPVINWQQWTQNDARTASNESGINGGSGLLIPSLSKYNYLQKLIQLPSYYFALLKHFIGFWRTRKNISDRISLPSIRFQPLVSSVLFSDICYNPPVRLSQPVQPEFLFEYNGQGYKVQSEDGNKSLETVSLYIPDAEELTRVEFQLLRRSGSPVFLPALASVLLLGQFLSRFFIPRLAASFDLDDDASTRTISRWEKRIALSRETFSRAKTRIRASLPTSKLSTDELADAAKAFGVFPPWLPSAMSPRAVLLEILHNHLNYLRADNILIGKWGGVWNMNDSDLNWALLERGATCTGLTREQKQSLLYIIIVAMSDLKYEVSYLLSDTSLTKEETETVLRLRNRLGFKIQDVLQLALKRSGSSG